MSVATSKTGNMPIGTADAGDSRGGATSGALFWAPTISPYAPDGTVNVHPYIFRILILLGLKWLIIHLNKQNDCHILSPGKS